tara:strand:+ start:111 stop:317 length:207 start_codon:yes stop_codon:yes gene_type:complete
MGHWEDFYYETHQTVNELNLEKEFSKQLEKMSTQDKHKYKDTKSRWEYALNKVLKTHKDKKKKSKDVI